MTVIQTQTEEKGVTKLSSSSQCQCVFWSPFPNAKSLPLLTAMINSMFPLAVGAGPCAEPTQSLPSILPLLVSFGSLSSLNMSNLSLVLVIGWRQTLLVLHQARLFLVNSSLPLGGLVVASAWMETAAVLREEGLSANKLSEETDENSSDQHAHDGYGDSSNDADKNREDDVRGHLPEEQRPTIRTVEHSVVLVVVAGRLGVAIVVVVAGLTAHHTSTAMHLHLVKLIGDDSLPLAQGGGAFVTLG